MHKKHISKKMIIIAIAILAAILLIAFFFPKSNGHSGDMNRKCTCIGFEKDNSVAESWTSTCFGIPINCVEYVNNDRKTIG